MYTAHDIQAALLGVAVGDALGVPVEFVSRAVLQERPVREMMGYGTHQQPAGTWSDDAAMTLCTAEALCTGFDAETLARLYVRWLSTGYWSAHGHVFDIGLGTRSALQRIHQGTPVVEAGGRSERDNGNGALMRILPLLFTNHSLPPKQRLHQIIAATHITHGHPRSVVANVYYLELAHQLKLQKSISAAYQHTNLVLATIIAEHSALQDELPHYTRVLSGQLHRLAMDDIQSSGYVVHSLEAALWCLLTTSSYAACVLQAVNLGDDSDTTAAIAGGLAGLHYGLYNIPPHWLGQLARCNDFLDLGLRLHQSISA